MLTSEGLVPAMESGIKEKPQEKVAGRMDIGIFRERESKERNISAHE